MIPSACLPRYLGTYLAPGFEVIPSLLRGSRSTNNLENMVFSQNYICANTYASSQPPPPAPQLLNSSNFSLIKPARAFNTHPTGRARPTRLVSQHSPIATHFTMCIPANERV